MNIIIRRFSTKDLIITPRAIQQLTHIKFPLRISVESGGCNGFQYKIEILKQADADDVEFSQEGTKVVVDKTSLEYIKGATLDYSQELIGSSFVILENPLAGNSCGCKTSFSIK